MRTVTIGGKEYPLKYLLHDRDDIEKACEKSIVAAMLSMQLGDFAVILAAGLKHVERNMTAGRAIDLLQREIDANQNYEGVMRRTFWAVAEGGLMGGKVDWVEFARVWPDPDKEQPEAPAAVPTAAVASDNP